KKIAILQSNYIPWKGYFDLINLVDEFVIFDEAQFTKNDWRNRNKLKTSQGIQWITIPVLQESLEQKIKNTKISNTNWNIKHCRTMSQSYSKRKYFSDYKDIFEDVYLNGKEENLSKSNYKFIVAINYILDIKTKIRWSSEFALLEGQTEKLLSICKQAGATS